MKRLICSLAFIAVLAVAVLASGASRASAHSSAATYQYLIGVEPLCSVNPDFCPDVAKAANGDSVIVTGSGTLSVHPNAVTGSGTFIHKRGAHVLAQGTWTAKHLLSFQVYGTSPDFPPTFTAGRAFMRIHLTPAAGGHGVDAILRVTCALA